MKQISDPRVQELVSRLLHWERTADSLSASRAALAELRHALPERERLRAAPYVAPLLGAAHEDDEHWFYFVACLFATHRQHKPGYSLGHAFRSLKDRKDQSDSIDSRFLQLLSADTRRLPDRLRPAVSLLAAQAIPLDWGRLLTDVLRWNLPGKPRQHQLARDFYSHFNTQNNIHDDLHNNTQDDDTKGLHDAESED